MKREYKEIFDWKKKEENERWKKQAMVMREGDV